MLFHFLPPLFTSLLFSSPLCTNLSLSLFTVNSCPVQNYHQGYNTNRGFRIYECGDKNYLSLDSKISALLHLTTHPKDFEKPCCGADKWTKEQIEEFRDYKKSELWKIVHWNQRRHLR